MGKSAQDSTGFKYPAGGGDDIGVYKQPMESKERASMNTVALPGNCMEHLNIGVAGISKGNVKGVNPTGTGEMRGYGAATKGRKISGKQG